MRAIDFHVQLPIPEFLDGAMAGYVEAAESYFRSKVAREMKGRLQDQFLFGSDYPFIQPQRCLEELSHIEMPEAVLRKVLVENGRRLLGLGEGV